MSENASQSSNSGANVIDITNSYKSLREGNTNLHHETIRKRTGLTRQLQKQRAFARGQWISMMFYARKRVVMREASSYQNKKNQRLDDASAEAIDTTKQVLSKHVFVNADFEALTKAFFEPLINYRSIPNVPEIEEAADDASERFMNGLDLDITRDELAKQFVQPITNINTYEKLIPNTKELNEKADDVIEDSIENIDKNPVNPSIYKIVTPLYVFPQDTMILNPINDMDAIIGQSAQQALLYNHFNAALPMVSKEIRPTFRSLLRYAYPRWDNEDPLDLEREPTLDEDDLNLGIDAAIEKCIADAQPSTQMSMSKTQEEGSNKLTIFDKIFQKKDEQVKEQQVTARALKMEDLDSQEDDAEKLKELKLRPGMKVRNFYYDLSSILQGLDDGVQRMLEPIPRIVMNHLLIPKQSIADLLFTSTSAIADKVANDPDQVIPEESLSFIDDAISESLIGFVSDATGLTDGYNDLINFNMKVAEQAILATLTTMTYSRFQEVTPFLVGAANIKTHKIEEENASGEKSPRRKKHTANPVFFTTE